MAIGRTNAGGGGTSLNFKVVGGTTQPTSPKENTIWVKTAIDIPYWTTASSAKAPAYVAQKGTVTFWWASATSAEVSSTTSTGFMPIKYKATNPPGYMRLKPINCYQNQDGTAAGWKPMEAFTYKGGQWVDWVTYLYSHGDECVDITGGWETLAYGGNSSSSTRKAPTLTKGDENMTISLTSAYIGSVWTVNAIDISNYKTLTMNVIGATNPEYRVVFGVIAEKKNNYTWVANVYAFDVGEHILDVSEITGSYYVVISIASATKSVTTDEIRLS